MRTLRSALLAVAVALATFMAPVTEGQNVGHVPGGTVWLPMRGAADPLVLTTITFGLDKRIQGGKVFNKGRASVAGYQLGLIVIERGTSDSKVIPGPVTQVTVPIKPEETRGMLEQPLEDQSLNRDLSLVAVFVLEVRFSDGSSWRAGTTRLQAEAERLARSSAKKP